MSNRCYISSACSLPWLMPRDCMQHYAYPDYGMYWVYISLFLCMWWPSLKLLLYTSMLPPLNEGNCNYKCPNFKKGTLPQSGGILTQIIPNQVYLWTYYMHASVHIRVDWCNEIIHMPHGTTHTWHDSHNGTSCHCKSMLSESNWYHCGYPSTHTRGPTYARSLPRWRILRAPAAS